MGGRSAGHFWRRRARRRRQPTVQQEQSDGEKDGALVTPPLSCGGCKHEAGKNVLLPTQMSVLVSNTYVILPEWRTRGLPDLRTTIPERSRVVQCLIVMNTSCCGSVRNVARPSTRHRVWFHWMCEPSRLSAPVGVSFMERYVGASVCDALSKSCATPLVLCSVETCLVLLR